MPTEEALVHVLQQVALGDEAATVALARFLDQRIDHVQAQRQAQEQQVSAAQVEAHYRGKEKYRKKVAAMARDYPLLDKEHDPEGFQVAAKIDARLAAKHPELSEDERLERAAELAYRRVGDPQDRDYSSAIATMRNARMPQEYREPAEEEDVDAERDSDELRAIENEIDQDRESSIAAMARSRGPRPGPELTEAQQTAIRLSRR